MEYLKTYVRKEIITPMVILAVLCVYVAAALKLSPPVVQGLIQESFFPLLIFILAAPAAIWILVKAIRKVQTEARKETGKKKFSVKPTLIFLITSLLILGFEPLGFFLTAPFYVFCFMLIYDDKPRQIIRKIIYTVLITAFVYVLYAVVFDIRFPRGVGL